MQLFVGQTSARMQQNCMKSADNFCYVGGEVTFFITEVCHNPDNQKSLPPFLWLPKWGPEQGLGPVYVLQYLCSKPLKLIESHKAINIFCHIHDVKRVGGR